MSFANKLETTEIDKYHKFIGMDSVRDMYNGMKEDYSKYDSQKEKTLLKLRLKDIINDVDKIPYLAIIIAIGVPVISTVLPLSYLYKSVILLLMYAVMGVYISSRVKYYRICKLYLEVIETIEQDRNDKDKCQCEEENNTLNNNGNNVSERNYISYAEYKKFFINITAILLVIAILIAFCFRINKYGNLLEIKDYLNFAGQFGGATLAAIVSFAVIAMTITEQKKQFDKQRKIDKKASDEQEQRFQKEYNLRFINQKLQTYKEIYSIVESIINKTVNIKSKILIKEHLKDGNKHINEVEELYQLVNKCNFMKVFITENELVESIENAYKILCELSEGLDKRPKDEIDDQQYIKYYENIINIYSVASSKLEKISKHIYINNIAKDMNIKK